ncbi:MAG: hypothetical protein KC448_15265 [Yoonia sp.]|nr:hypothetical protein [Yoonia sp.]
MTHLKNGFLAGFSGKVALSVITAPLMTLVPNIVFSVDPGADGDATLK